MQCVIVKNQDKDFSMRANKFASANTFASAATNARSKTLAMPEQSAIKNEFMSNQKLAEELHKSIIRKFEKPKVPKVYLSLVDSNWHLLILMSKKNYEDPIIKVGDHVKTSKQKHFCKKLHIKLDWRNFCDHEC